MQVVPITYSEEQTYVIIIIIFFIPQVVKIPGVKNYKSQVIIIMQSLMRRALVIRKGSGLQKSE